MAPKTADQTNAGAPFELSGFDLISTASRMAGNWNGVRRALQTFAVEFEMFPEQLKEFIASGQLADATKLIHTIKGVSGNIGATALHQASKTLEAELKAGGFTALAAFEADYAATIDAIRQLPAPEERDTKTEAFDAGLARERLQTLITILALHRIVPRQLLADLRAMLTGGPAMPIFAKLERQIDAFEYGEGIATAQEIAATLSIKLQG